MIGFNDLRYRSNAEILGNIVNILSQIDARKVFIQSILPVDSSMSDNNNRIVQLNRELQKFCNRSDYSYIDLHSYFLGKDDGLSSQYSRDSVHLNRTGYLIWSKHIRSLLMAQATEEIYNQRGQIVGSSLIVVPK